jgi:hypothetical protein
VFGDGCRAEELVGPNRGRPGRNAGVRVRQPLACLFGGKEQIHALDLGL